MDRLAKLEREEAEAEKLLEPATEDENKQTTDEPTIEPAVEENKQVAPVEPEPVAVEPDKVVEPPKVTPPAKTDDWEQKYKTLDGKYKAEIPRLQAENNDLRSKIGALEKQLSELNEKFSHAEAAKSSDEIDEEIKTLEEYDPRLASVAKKIKANADEKIKSVEKKLGERSVNSEKSVETGVAAIKLMRFDTEMAKFGVPDWRELDQDEGFINWLGALVPYTKFTKLQYLQEAGRNYDAETASKFFLDYKKEIASATPPSTDNQGKLNKVVAPPKGGAGSPPIKAAQPTGLTRESYQKFMQETAKGKFNPKNWGGKTEEQVEAMFDEAIAKGELV